MTPAGELVLATLWLARDRAREERLARAAAAVRDWPAALAALEAHGVLGLAHRNLAWAGAELPAEAARALAARQAVLRRIELGFRLTLERYLAATRVRGVAVTLLKGAALAQDLYGPGLRASGDLDLLVAPEDVPAAVEAALAIGLGEPRGALPEWWYRRFHFHRKFTAEDAWQRELELHWHLHHESALLAVRLEELLARRVRVESGLAAWTLEPLDRYLHLVTHLARHVELARLAPEELARQCADPRAPLRAKWLLDLRAELEQRRFTPAALLERAREWNATEELDAVLDVLLGLGLESEAERLAHAVRAELAPGRPRAGRAQRNAPLPGLDLRASNLRLVPRWLWPPTPRLAGLARGSARARTRREQFAGALGQLLPALVLTPAAWLLRRRRWSGRGLAPDELLGLVAHARGLEKGV